MNPLSFLQQHGLSPDNFRDSVPLRAPGTDAATARYRALTPIATGDKMSPQPAGRGYSRYSAPAPDTLLGKFLLAKGWRGSSKTAYGPLVPYLLADLVMLTYEEYLKHHLTHAPKKHARAMMESYHRFIHDFFNCFGEADKDAVIDLMDTFGGYLHNDLEVFRLSIQAPLMEYPSEFRTRLSAICVCRLLSAHANECYSAMYSTTQSNDPSRHHIHSMEHCSRELFASYLYARSRAGRHSHRP